MHSFFSGCTTSHSVIALRPFGLGRNPVILREFASSFQPNKKDSTGFSGSSRGRGRGGSSESERGRGGVSWRGDSGQYRGASDVSGRGRGGFSDRGRGGGFSDRGRGGGFSDRGRGGFSDRGRGGGFSDRGAMRGRGRGSFQGRGGRGGSNTHFRGSDDDDVDMDEERGMSGRGGRGRGGRAEVDRDNNNNSNSEGDTDFDFNSEGESEQVSRGRGSGRGGLRGRGRGGGGRGGGFNNNNSDAESEEDGFSQINDRGRDGGSRGRGGRYGVSDNNRGGFDTSEGNRGARSRYFVRKTGETDEPTNESEDDGGQQRGGGGFWGARGRGGWRGGANEQNTKRVRGRGRGGNVFNERGGRGGGRQLGKYLEQQRENSEEEDDMMDIEESGRVQSERGGRGRGSGGGDRGGRKDFTQQRKQTNVFEMNRNLEAKQSSHIPFSAPSPSPSIEQPPLSKNVQKRAAKETKRQKREEDSRAKIPRVQIGKEEGEAGREVENADDDRYGEDMQPKEEKTAREKKQAKTAAATAYQSEQKKLLKSLEKNEESLQEENINKEEESLSYEEKQENLLENLSGPKLARKQQKEKSFLAKEKMQGTFLQGKKTKLHLTGELIYGTHSVLAALEANKRIFHTLYHQESKDVGANDEKLLRVLRLANKYNIPLRDVPKALIDKGATYVTNGLMLDCGELPVLSVKAPSEQGGKQAVLEANSKYEPLDADLLRRLLFSQPLPFSAKTGGKLSSNSNNNDENNNNMTEKDTSLNPSLIASLVSPPKQNASLTSSSSSSPLDAVSSSSSSSTTTTTTTSDLSPSSPPLASSSSASSSDSASSPEASGLPFSSLSFPSLPPLWVALDNVHDHVNIGGIMRTAHFFNCSGVLLGGNCCDKLTAVISKSSAGAMECTNIVKVADIARLLHSVTHHFPSGDKWRVVALSLDDRAHDLREFKRDAPTIVVVGNEGEGLRPPVANACSHTISIKTVPGGVGELDSLNASTATAVALYQLSGNLTQI